jgi:hypothetical protein
VSFRLIKGGGRWMRKQYENQRDGKISKEMQEGDLAGSVELDNQGNFQTRITAGPTMISPETDF